MSYTRRDIGKSRLQGESPQSGIPVPGEPNKEDITSNTNSQQADHHMPDWYEIRTPEPYTPCRASGTCRSTATQMNRPSRPRSQTSRTRRLHNVIARSPQDDEAIPWPLRRLLRPSPFPPPVAAEARWATGLATLHPLRAVRCGTDRPAGIRQKHWQRRAV